MIFLELLISPVEKPLEKNHNNVVQWLLGLSLVKAQHLCLWVPVCHNSYRLTGEGVAGHTVPRRQSSPAVPPHRVDGRMQRFPKRVLCRLHPENASGNTHSLTKSRIIALSLCNMHSAGSTLKTFRLSVNDPFKGVNLKFQIIIFYLKMESFLWTANRINILWNMFWEIYTDIHRMFFKTLSLMRAPVFLIH